MIRAVAFDLDGVLVDAVEWHFQAFTRALSYFGYSLSREEHQTAYNGLPTRLKLEIFSQRSSLPRALHPFLNELKQKFTREIIECELKQNPEIVALCEKLKADGLKLAVATNSTRATLDLFLSRLRLTPYFDVTVSQEEVATPKPDPAVYLEAQRQLNVTAEELLIVEDSLAGITAARRVTANLVVVRSPREVTYERIIKACHRNRRKQPTSPELEIVIPMAGQGQRFHEKGYAEPKPLIPIFGRPMVDWVVENLRPSQTPHRFTFLCRSSHLEETRLSTNLKWLAPGSEILEVPDTTQGAACTVLLAAESIDLTKPLVVANVDQWLGTSLDAFYTYASQSGCDGLILTFPSNETKWSYARTADGKRVLEVAEKQVISADATVGIYYFRTGATFVEAAQAMIRNNTRTRGEFYLCPVFNEMIRAGLRVEIFPIPEFHMHGLGTPEDLEHFVRWSLQSSAHLPELPQPARPSPQ